MIKIVLPVDANGTKVWFEGSTPTAEEPFYKMESLHVEARGVTGRLVLASALSMQPILIVDDGSGNRLMTWAEAVERGHAETRTRAAAALEKLNQDLRQLGIKVDGSVHAGAAATFLGIKGIAAATTTFSLEITPPSLLPARALPDDAPILRATARATFSGGFTSPLAVGAADAEVEIDVVLTQAGVLEALPRVQVPTLPHLAFILPALDLPQWSLDGLSFPRPDFFRLPLPKLLPIAVTWNPSTPTANLSIVNDRLQLRTSPADATVTFDGQRILTATGVVLTVDPAGVKVDAINVAGGANAINVAQIDLSDAFGPLKVTLSDVQADVTVQAPGGGPVGLIIKLAIGRLLIQARTDPSLVLAVAATVELSHDGTTLTPKLTRLDIVEPYPIEIALLAGHVIASGARRLLSFIQKIEIPAPGTLPRPGLPSVEALVAVIRRIGDLAAAAAAWLAEQDIAAARAVAGLAESALKLLGEVVAGLADAIRTALSKAAAYVVVEVRIDLDRRRVVQLIVTPSDPGTAIKAFKRELLGFTLSVPFTFRPALVYDFEQDWMAVVLQASKLPDAAITLSTDLWLDNAATGTTEPVSGAETEQASPTPLLTLAATPQKDLALAVAGLQSGKAFFMRKLETSPTKTDIVGAGGQVVVKAGDHLLAAEWSELKAVDIGDEVEIKLSVEKDRVLSLFRSTGPSAGSGGGGLADQLSQYIKVVDQGKPSQSGSTISLPLEIEIIVAGAKAAATVTLSVDVETLSMTLAGGRFAIGLKHKSFVLLGLDGEFSDKRPGREADPEPPLVLDLSDGNPRLGLNDNTRLKLAYRKLSSSGPGLGFDVDRFMVSRDGVDLSAAVNQDSPVPLAGVDMPFRFDQGELSVKRNRIQAFALTGHGNLPPALVGEAKASIKLNFAQRDGGLALQAAEAVLDKTADPLRCEGTQFSITVTKLGLKFVEQGGYHFYFTLTGAAEFRPRTDAFSTGLLKNLSALKITLNEAPLAADARILLKHIDFQVTVDPPKRSSFFDLFAFELRGVGFHPASDAFGGSPALSISGQVNFTDFADIVTPRFDFHKLWIAPPEQGKILPRIRFDGLGVGLSFGSMAEASGTAIAVDGKLPTLFAPDALPSDVTATGFLASGSLRIQGWASMSASMGFLELEKAGIDEKRQAFFLYLQRNDLSEKIPTPIGTFILREVGFGFPYRYTLAGLAKADSADTPRELVKLLDEISKSTGSFHDVNSWLTTFDNAALTLALRGLFSITTASTSSFYNAEKEKDLPNLVLFDVVAALRTDLTFLMNMRAWIAYNYADWREAREKKSAWINNPTVTGYMYLSVPRREFLARGVYNPGGEIGEHPKLPDQLKQAMKRVRWSSTLYIRPGLFHMEHGWPYELGFSLGDPNGRFYLAVEGGTVLRFEDAAILYGIAFRARGFARFEASTGGSFGASISARADFALGAKLIAYLSQNVSDTMFYGVIVLDVTIVFSVQMWLETRWFSLSVGFSASLTIHVGIELLLEPAGLAARIEASVAVSAFGRTLSIGIGFSLGSTDRLSVARMRVERFLALGLGSTYPDPEAGVPVSRPAPLPEPSRERNAAEADRRVDSAAERTAASAPAGEAAPIGRRVRCVDYWALIFPVAKTSGSSAEENYLVQLVPRDDTAKPRQAAEERPTQFYAAPATVGDAGISGGVEYEVEGLERGEILSSRVAAKAGEPDVFTIATDWGASFGLNGTGDENARELPNLGEAFAAGCFLPGHAFGPPALETFVLTDIDAIPWEDDCEFKPDDPEKGDKFLPDDPEEASKVLKNAAQSRADCGPALKRALQVDEARSCFIATVADCAEKLARMISVDSDGHMVVDHEGHVVVEGDPTRELEVDPRAIGLTFVLTEKRLKGLFPTMDQNTDEPPTSGTFTVATRLPVRTDVPAYGDTRPVALFNPPKRMFRQTSPALNDCKPERRATGIMIYWDLDWRWKASRSRYADPEYHLKHYRIERHIEGLPPRQDVPLPAPRPFEVKKSDHIEIVLHKREENGKEVSELRRRRYRSRLQLADDLQDLPAALRTQLLRQVVPSDRAAAAQASLLTGPARIVYAVLPIDCAGTAGIRAPDIRIEINPIETPARSFFKAIARFRYATVPALGEDFTSSATDFLALMVEEEAPARGKVVPPPGRIQIRVRTERTIAVGIFGVDALSQARSEPPVPARDARRPGVGEVDIELAPGPGFHTVMVTRVVRQLAVNDDEANREAPADTETQVPYNLSNDGWKALVAALDLGSTARVHASRLYLRPVPTTTTPKLYHLDPDWTPVQLQMQIGAPGEMPAVDITVERFEHPLDVRFQAITSECLFPASGRLHLYHPAHDASFSAFLTEADPHEKAAGPSTLSLLRDGDRRTAVTLAWNARPANLGIVGEISDNEGTIANETPDRHTLVAGYDVFALDATAIPKEAPEREGWPDRFVASVGRVQRLPTAERGQEPSETGDFARVEVLYPSETRRLEAAGFGKRRATWFSPAESFLIWPRRVLRRSILTQPEEVDIAALFARGRPKKISIAWHQRDKDKPAWPSNMGPAPCFALIRPNDEPPFLQPDHGFTPADLGSEENVFTVDLARRLLLDLVLLVDPKADGLFEDRRDAVANLAVALAPSLGDKPGAGDAEARVVSVSLTSALHPVLADTLDLVQYHRGKPTYRRYEPVLDASPPTEAAGVGAYLEETPADRDPSSWGVLRTLGLAAAFRLYDVETGAFLTGRATLTLLKETLAAVLPRYKEVADAIGAPFVDMMFTIDGLGEVTSFHGSAPLNGTEAAGTLRDRALALVQIELRPTPQPLVVGYAPDEPPPGKDRASRRVIRYGTIRRLIKGDRETLLLKATRPGVLLEIEPMVRTAGEDSRRVLLMNGRDGTHFPAGGSQLIAGGLRLLVEPGEETLAHVRVIAFEPAVSIDDLDGLIEVTKVSVQPNTPLTPLKVAFAAAPDQPIGEDAKVEPDGPWGRFADLSDRCMAALLFGDGLSGTPMTPKAIEDRLRAMPYGDTLLVLLRGIGRTKVREPGDGIPNEPDKRLRLAGNLVPWTRRFLERGPAHPVKPEVTGLAFAMLTRPNPWRVAPDSEGRLSILLLEKDRFGKMRKYAVRPFGRYENLVRAAEIDALARKAAIEKTTAPVPPPPGLDAGAFRPGYDEMTKHFADVVIERTEPLAAPIILAARRPATDVNAVEVIVSRHPEEILSEANIPVDAGLAMRHVAVAFWREFAAPQWARAVEKRQGATSSMNLLEPFGPFKDTRPDYSRMPEPKELTFVRTKTPGSVPVYDLEEDRLRGWYKQHPDLWRGSYVLTLADMPYGFRLHATAHAAAGVVVSPTTVASVAEASDRLVLPWTTGDAGATQWQNREILSKPSWSLEATNERKVTVRWPLVRIVDGMTKNAKAIWFGADAAPAVYRLPDPAVSYRLLIETADGRVRVGEAEISAIGEEPDVPRAEDALYLLQAIGPRFEEPTFDALQLLPSSAGDPTHYELAIKLTLRKGAAQGPPEPEEPVFGVTMDPAPLPTDVTVDPAGMERWGLVAPEAIVSLVVEPPIPPQSWADFQSTMNAFVGRLQAYALEPVPSRVRNAVDAIVKAIQPYVVGSVAAWPGPKNPGGTAALPASLTVSWLLGLPVASPVHVRRPGAWTWPMNPGRGARLADFRDAVARALHSGEASDALKRGVAEALGTYAIGWMVHAVAARRHRDEIPWRGWLPIRRAAPPGLSTDGLAVSIGGPFDFLASVRLPEDGARTATDVERAFVTIENEPGAADTLEGLIALWSAPAAAAGIYLRWSAWAKVNAALMPLAGGSFAPRVDGVLLRTPVLASEAAPLGAVDPRLPDLLDSITGEFLFGSGRLLLLQAFQGSAKPQDHPVERLER